MVIEFGSRPDPRIVRTRSLLMGAARALILEGSGAPTLADVARRAGLSRQAAYSNYGDLRGLLLALVVDSLGLDDQFAVIGGRIAPRPDARSTSRPGSRARFAAVATQIQEDGAFFVRLASGDLWDVMAEVVAEFCRAAVLAAGWRTSDGSDLNQIDVDFAIGGVRSVFEGWIRAPYGRTPDEMTNELIDRLVLLGWRDREEA